MNFLNILLGHNKPQKGIPLTQQKQFGQHGNPLLMPAGKGRQYEDGALVNGAQGLVPLNQSIARLHGGMPQQGFGPQVQNVGGYPMSLQGSYMRPQLPQLNPQVYDQGYYWNQ